MRRILTLLILGLITSFLSWVYIQRANLDYNSEGMFLSLEEGVVYHEQTKEVFGVLALLGLILTVIFVIKLIRTNKIA